MSELHAMAKDLGVETHYNANPYQPDHPIQELSHD